MERLARWLVEWQWPDGGWNCDVHASGRRSSFHETHGPIDGLSAYAAATGSFSAREAANAGSELLLDHHLIRPLTLKKPADVMNPDFLRLRFPAYWHYDVLRGLVVLARAGHASDPRPPMPTPTWSLGIHLRDCGRPMAPGGVPRKRRNRLGKWSIGALVDPIR